MCVLDCAPSALKMLHNSTEFMPYVIFIAAPGMEQLRQLYAERRATGGSQRNLAVCSLTHLILREKIQSQNNYGYDFAFHSLIGKALFAIAHGEHERSNRWHLYTR